MQLDPEYDCQNSEFKAMAFTLKKLRDPKNATLENYSDVLQKWMDMGLKIEAAEFERDSKGILHIHGIVVMRKNFYRMRMKTTDYSLKLRDVYDKSGWIAYINKDKVRDFDKSEWGWAEPSKN